MTRVRKILMSMQARGDSIVQNESNVVVQLGMTPRYLDLHCHEALYEVDVGVNELRDQPEGDVVRGERAGVRGLHVSRTGASPQGSLMRR